MESAGQANGMAGRTGSGDLVPVAVGVPRFRVLGPVQVRFGDQDVALGGARQTSVLAALLLDAGRSVPVDTVLERVWGTSPPPTARDTLYGYVSRLRRALLATTGVVIERDQAGYRLSGADGSIDLHGFRAGVAAAGRSAHPGERLRLLDQALSLWWGEPLYGIDTPWANGVRAGLLQERLAARLDRNDVRLQLGLPDAVLADAEQPLVDAPFDERLAGQVALALHRCGRTADAVEHLIGVRRRLADEMGLDPGRRLVELQQQLLAGPGPAEPFGPGTGDPEPTPAKATAAAAVAVAVPHELPAPPIRMEGRSAEIAALDGLVDSLDVGGAVAVLHGVGGVGKSALATWWAHRVRDRFPGGQLVLDLQGFRGVPPTPPAAALELALISLGVAPASIPTAEAARTALLRTVTHDRRLLVVLDDARSADQVSPLLPGSGNATVVTSRNQLRPLVIRGGARPIPLRPLTPETTAGLLRELVGAGPEDGDVERLARWSGGLPLAARVLAERLSRVAGSSSPDLGPAPVVAGPDDGGLEEVFSWSYRALPELPARVFRLLGLAPPSGVAADAVAALADLPVDDAAAALEVLVAHSMVESPRPGRYRCHDLLREFAVALVGRTETPAQRATATSGVLKHYAERGGDALVRLVDPARLLGLTRTEDASAFADHTSALAWFEQERQALIDAVTLALAAGRTDRALHLCRSLFGYVRHTKRWGMLRDVLQRTWDAAPPIEQDRARLVLTSYWGILESESGDYDEAERWWQLAVDLTHVRDDPAARGRMLDNIGTLHMYRGNPERALPLHEEATRIARETGDDYSECGSTNNHSIAASRAGRFPEAVRLARHALELHLRGRGAWPNLHGSVLDSLGMGLMGTGEDPEAAAAFGAAMEAHRACGQEYDAALAQKHRSELYSRVGDDAAAGQDLREARTVFERLQQWPSDGE